MDEARIREILTEHGYHPAGKRLPVNEQGRGYVTNPYCGDELTVYLDCQSNGEYRFVYQGQGCSICMASASILSSTVLALSLEELTAIYQKGLRHILHQESNKTPAEYEEWEALAWFHQNPRKLTCVEVAWKAAGLALVPS